jgi:hypothetical protein
MAMIQKNSKKKIKLDNKNGDMGSRLVGHEKPP